MLTTTPPAQLTDRLWMLGTTRHLMYLIKGENECAIVEGGVGPLGPLVREQLAEIGIDPNQIKQAVITHAHPDHVMAIPMVREMCPNVSVIASQAAAKTLSIEKAISFFAKIDDGFSASLLSDGQIEKRHKRPPLAEATIGVDRVVKEGDTIDVSPFQFSVIETPGHSDCHICFHDPNAKILIISDATGYYMTDPDYWWPNYFTDYGDYLASMRKLAALDADVLCLSHNAAVTGANAIQEYFAAAIEWTEKYHQRIIDETKAGKSFEDLSAILGAEAYKHSPFLPEDFFVKNCALLIMKSKKHEGIE
jgi:glyoxylase-like metal-dependent hydrolase (beta-lactamase superfamily II)